MVWPPRLTKSLVLAVKMATKRVEFMTKDELKKELRRFDVDFAPTMNKDYYIKLYKENCLKRSTKFSEFSSDEELSSKSPRKTKKVGRKRYSSNHWSRSAIVSHLNTEDKS